MFNLTSTLKRAGIDYHFKLLKQIKVIFFLTLNRIIEAALPKKDFNKKSIKRPSPQGTEFPSFKTKELSRFWKVTAIRNICTAVLKKKVELANKTVSKGSLKSKTKTQKV